MNVMQRTFGIFDKNSSPGGGRFALPGLIDSEHAEVVLALLDQVGYVEYRRRRRHLVDSDPVVRVCVFLLDEVAEDATAAVRARLLPSQRDEVAADLLSFRLTRRVRLICTQTCTLSLLQLVEQGLTSHSTQFRSFRRRCFYRSDDPTNSVKALKEGGG